MTQSVTPPIINSTDDFNCDICGLPLKGATGYVASLTRPVDPNKPDGFHEIFKAIHVDCYEPKNDG